MKRIIRSTFEPLPRSLPTPGLIALVAIVVLGTAFTVHRYLESSSTTERHALSNAARGSSLGIGEVRAAAGDAGASSSASCPFFGPGPESRTDTTDPAAGSNPSVPSQCSSPSVFQPGDASSTADDASAGG